jgi:hypothetical protein
VSHLQPKSELIEQFLRTFWLESLRPLNPEWEGVAWDDLDGEIQKYWRTIIERMGALVVSKILALPED